MINGQENASAGQGRQIQAPFIQFLHFTGLSMLILSRHCSIKILVYISKSVHKRYSDISKL